jgi:ribose/xylose/arabinose/galactoside ABC-type transport system permease subunit
VGLPFSTVFYLGATLVAGLVLKYTIIGRRLYAIGGDEKTARYAGINVDKWIILAFVVSGVCAALAGILFTARLGSVDAPLGVGYELTAIAIAVIGGTSLSGGRGSPYGTLLGGMVLAASLNLLNVWGVGTWYQNLVVGGVLIAAVVIGRRRSGA